MITWCPTKNLGPIGSVVLTFIGYKQTNRQTDRQAKFIYRYGYHSFYFFSNFMLEGFIYKWLIFNVHFPKKFLKVNQAYIIIWAVLLDIELCLLSLFALIPMEWELGLAFIKTSEFDQIIIKFHNLNIILVIIISL